MMSPSKNKDRYNVIFREKKFGSRGTWVDPFPNISLRCSLQFSVWKICRHGGLWKEEQVGGGWWVVGGEALMTRIPLKSSQMHDDHHWSLNNIIDAHSYVPTHTTQHNFWDNKRLNQSQIPTSSQHHAIATTNCVTEWMPLPMLRPNLHDAHAPSIILSRNNVVVWLIPSKSTNSHHPSCII